jgi:hypothetical protein
LTGQLIEVVSLGVGEAQRPCKRTQDRGRRIGCPPLLQPRQVVHRYAGEPGDLLTTQPDDPSLATGRETDICGTDPLAPGAQAASELVGDRRVHLTMMAHRRTLEVVLSVLGSPDPF